MNKIYQLVGFFLSLILYSFNHEIGRNQSVVNIHPASDQMMINKPLAILQR